MGDYTEISKAVFLALVLAVVVIVVVGPYVDQLGQARAAARENDAIMLMEEADGLSLTLELDDVETDGVPRAAYSLTGAGGESSLSLQGYDFRLWLSESFVLMATSSGILYADGSQEWLREAGDYAAFAAGTLSLSSGTSASFESLAAPSESGALALCAAGARVSTFGPVSLFNLNGTSAGTLGDVPGWEVVTEEGDGYAVIVSAEDSEGVSAVGAVVPLEYYSAEGGGAASAAMKAVPVLLLVGILFYGAAAVYRRL